jgi:hypothetical protein
MGGDCVSEIAEDMEFNDIEEISSSTAASRIEFAENLRTLAADIIAGRAFAAVYAAYSRDDPHTLIAHGIFGGFGEVIHMQSDINDYFYDVCEKLDSAVCEEAEEETE